jgi:quinoprotein glucose dehydrogenase
VQGTIISPGIESAEWGGTAYDPETGLLYINANEMPWIVKLKKQSASAGSSGSTLYRDNCASCHAENRAGHPPEFPSLIGVGERLMSWDILTKIVAGGSRMPAFPSLTTAQAGSIMNYLQTGADLQSQDTAAADQTSTAQKQTYVVARFSEFLDPDGYPAISPPWGTLSAIDVNSGRYVWKISFGEYPELIAAGLQNTGSQNYGGAIVTAGGLLFIGATSFDKKFHAYDKRTGLLLWETTLPAAGNATPATYRVNSRQFVVIAAGGGRPPKAERGSTLVAFALFR